MKTVITWIIPFGFAVSINIVSESLGQKVPFANYIILALVARISLMQDIGRDNDV